MPDLTAEQRALLNKLPQSQRELVEQAIAALGANQFFEAMRGLDEAKKAPGRPSLPDDSYLDKMADLILDNPDWETKPGTAAGELYDRQPEGISRKSFIGRLREKWKEEGSARLAQARERRLKHEEARASRPSPRPHWSETARLFAERFAPIAEQLRPLSESIERLNLPHLNSPAFQQQVEGWARIQKALSLSRERFGPAEPDDPEAGK